MLDLLVLSDIHYIHEVCQSCTKLVYGVVPQEQWIWGIHGVLFHGLTVSRSRTLEFSVFTSQMIRLRLV